MFEDEALQQSSGPSLTRRKALGLAGSGVAGALLASRFGAAPARAQETTKVSIWIPSGFETDVTEELLDEFKAQNPDLETQLVVSPQIDFYQKLQTAFQAGSPPDVMPLQPFFNMPTFAKAGFLAPLTDRVAASTALDFDTLYQPDVYKFDGQVYSLPFTTNLWRIGYNKEIYDKLGLAVPTSWDELLANVQATTVDGNFGWSSVLYEDSWAVYYFGDFLAMNDAYIVKVGGTESGVAETPFREALEFFTTLNKEYAPPGVISTDADMLAAAFAQGKVAHFAMGSWWEPVLQPLGFEYKTHYDSFANPAGPSRAEPDTAAVGDSWAWGLAANSGNTEGGWRLLEFLARPETRAKINSREAASGPKERELAGARYETPWWTDYLGQLDAGPVLPPVQPLAGAVAGYKAIRETLIATITESKTLDAAVSDLDVTIKELLAQ
jgi:ABC-type glycerol-3-phosphate transport system substrate-binding protein